MEPIAVGYAEIGEYNQVFQIAKTIQPYEDIPTNVGRTPDGLINGSTSNEVFTQLAGQFAEAKQYNLALQAIEEIKWSANKSAAMAKLAVEYARRKQYDHLQSTLGFICSESLITTNSVRNWSERIHEA